MKNKPFIDEKAMQRFQERATRSALSTEHVYHELLHPLLARLELILAKPAVIANVGWHANFCHAALQEKYPDATIIDVCDLSELKKLEDNAVDFIVSHFALMSEREPPLFLSECRRVLRDEGLLLFVEVGPDTLMELRASFAAVDSLPHVHAFVDMHDIGDWMKQLHFSDPVMDREEITLAYDHLDLLFEDLKSIGMNNAHQARRRGLLSKNKWQAMLLHYAQYKKEDYFPATVEMIYGQAWKIKSILSDESSNEIVISVDSIQRKY